MSEKVIIYFASTIKAYATKKERNWSHKFTKVCVNVGFSFWRSQDFSTGGPEHESEATDRAGGGGGGWRILKLCVCKPHFLAHLMPL